VLLTYPQTEALELAEQRVVVFKATARTGQPPAEVAVGVLGAGNFAQAVLLPALKRVSGLRLIGIASASGASAQHAAKRFGFDYAASDEERILTDPVINTVAILTRHHLHAPQVLAALAAGKHVFCEKPLALNSDELDQIAEALRNPETPLLMVGFNRRFAPLSLRLADFLAARREPLVAHYRVNAGYLPPEHWLHDPAQGGGRIIGEGCHFIDWLTFLVGEPPKALHAHALPDGGRYHRDNVVVTLEYPDGSLGTLTYLANGDKAVAKERIEVFCEGKMAVLDDFRRLELVSDGTRQVFRARLRQDKGHGAEWQAFAQAILDNGPPPIPYADLLAVTRATFTINQSLERGEGVSLPE